MLNIIHTHTRACIYASVWICKYVKGVWGVGALYIGDKYWLYGHVNFCQLWAFYTRSYTQSQLLVACVCVCVLHMWPTVCGAHIIIIIIIKCVSIIIELFSSSICSACSPPDVKVIHGQSASAQHSKSFFCIRCEVYLINFMWLNVGNH